jgi:hypothetical protein
LEKEGPCNFHVFSRYIRHYLQRKEIAHSLRDEAHDGPIMYVAHLLVLFVLYSPEHLDDQAPVALWSYLEQAIGIICGCLPTFRALLGRMFPKLNHYFGLTTNNSNGSGSNSNNKANPYNSAITNNRSGRTGNSFEYDIGDVELGKKGTSEERIFIGVAEAERLSDESNHFRLVPADANGGTIGTLSTATAQNVNARPHSSWGNPGMGGFLRCPKDASIKLENRGKINITQTVDVRK